jgi:hypothetical protein
MKNKTKNKSNKKNFKKNKVRADRVAQVVEHLPSKHKVLSSNPSTIKKKMIK